MTPDDVLAELRALQAGDLPTHGGATMAYVYDSGRAGIERARGRRAGRVPVDATPSTRRRSRASRAIENDLVGAALALLGGDAATPSAR